MAVQTKKKSSKIAKSLIGAAGVHYVVSELSRGGMIALPTTRNTPGYDVLAVSPNGRRHANIQVKTSLAKVGFWPCDHPDKAHTGPQDYYVLVRGNGKNAEEFKFEAFMATGKEAKAALLKARDDVLSRNKVFKIPNLCLRYGNHERWGRRWKSWTRA